MSDAVEIALQQVGKPYVWDTPTDINAANPPSFDCSGLTMWSAHKAGNKPTLPHLASGQYALLHKVPIANRQRGDLMFFNDGGSIHHVVMVVDESTLVEAPTQGVPVRTRNYQVSENGLMSHVGRFSNVSNTGTLATMAAAGATADNMGCLLSLSTLPLISIIVIALRKVRNGSST